MIVDSINKNTEAKTKKIFKSSMSKIKSNPYYTRGITPKRATSGGAHLRDLAPGRHSSEESSQWWRAVGDTVPI